MGFIVSAFREVLLFCLSLAAMSFLLMIYTRSPFSEIPAQLALFGGAIFYLIRVLVGYLVHLDNRSRYRRMRGDSHIRVMQEPKFKLWKFIVYSAIFVVIVLFLYQCVHQWGEDGFELPIRMGSIGSD